MKALRGWCSDWVLPHPWKGSQIVVHAGMLKYTVLNESDVIITKSIAHHVKAVPLKQCLRVKMFSHSALAEPFLGTSSINAPFFKRR